MDPDFQGGIDPTHAHTYPGGPAPLVMMHDSCCPNLLDHNFYYLPSALTVLHSLMKLGTQISARRVSSSTVQF